MGIAKDRKIQQVAMIFDDDGGAVVVFGFDNIVEIEGKEVAFPVTNAQVNRLFKLILGDRSERYIDHLKKHSPILLPNTREKRIFGQVPVGK